MAEKKRSSVADDQAPKKTVYRRLNVKITEDAYERILFHAIKAKRAPGELVTELIDDHLKDWKIVRNNPTRLVDRDRHDSAIQARNSDAA